MKTRFWIWFLLLPIVSLARAETFEVVATPLPPLMYQEEGVAKGFYVDILQAMLQNMKDTDVKITFFPAPRMFMTLSNSSRVFSLAIARDDTRESLYKWVGPVYPRIFSLYKLRNRPEIRIDRLDDARSYRIGVGRGYEAENDLLKAGIPKENIDEAVEDANNIKKLFARRIDLVIMNDVMLQYGLIKEGHAWEEVEKTVVINDKYEFWFAFNKDFDNDTITRFQQALTKIKNDGKYAEIVEKYFPK